MADPEIDNGGGGGWTYAGFSLCWCELCIVIAFIYCHLIERAHKTEDRKFLTVSSPFTKPAFGYANGNTLHIKFLLVVLRFCFSYCYDLRLYGNLVSFFFLLHICFCFCCITTQPAAFDVKTFYTFSRAEWKRKYTSTTLYYVLISK